MCIRFYWKQDQTSFHILILPFRFSLSSSSSYPFISPSPSSPPLPRYRDSISESAQLVQWLWQTLDLFTNEEKILFLRFVSGRSRLPAHVSEISQRFQITKGQVRQAGIPCKIYTLTGMRVVWTMWYYSEGKICYVAMPNKLVSLIFHFIIWLTKPWTDNPRMLWSDWIHFVFLNRIFCRIGSAFRHIGSAFRVTGMGVADWVES